MKMKRKLLATSICLCSTASYAESNLQFHVDGFLTAGFGVLSAEQVFTQQIDSASLPTLISFGLPPQYDTVLVRPEIYNYNSKMDFQQPAIAGINGRVSFLDNYSAAMQITGLGSNEFDAQIEWAYLEYRVNKAWDFRLGRLRLPLYMFSDTLEVGYSYPWVTPPGEIYSLVPFSNYAGAEVVYDNQVFDHSLRASLFYGSLAGTNVTHTLATNITLKQLLGGYLTYGDPDLQMRLGYAEANISINPAPAFVPIIDAYAEIYGAPDVISDYDYQSVKAYFMNAGLEINKNDWLFLGEIVEQSANSVSVNKTRAWYATLGYKFCSDWTPFVSYAQQITLNKAARVYDGPLGVAINPIVSALNNDQKTWTVGLRWDVIDKTDIKLQVDHIEAENGTAGLFNVDPQHEIYLVRGTVDLIF